MRRQLAACPSLSRSCSQQIVHFDEVLTQGAVCSGKQIRKCSRRDLPLAMALGLDGATTVSATMLLAARAGIHVFVTGGAPFRSAPVHHARSDRCIAANRRALQVHMDFQVAVPASCVTHSHLSMWEM